MAAYLQELFNFGLYKRTQGRYARQVTMYALMVLVACGVWSLRGWLEGQGASAGMAIATPLAVLALGFWASFRLVHLPQFADFLISVEAEMNKVAWPSQGKLIRASVVVILVIFLLAALLFAYDLIWKSVFGALLG
ncbi:preprotein translocase subunit SecE [Pseudobythopirellula maris]|uniref:Preprotein translocase subunit SecE n=1 Tax=Pseudobythopirellula maris TaxID=2527991 RepID=A0A5C5ZNY3_9BACT|nr:preprotein translocase subunit SecE [Pseudobythopirellula maris]TWT88143.1 preprotein translocase subunit SecE [Pseudobythopirellula maris]